jgi:hypothetical protein
VTVTLSGAAVYAKTADTCTGTSLGPRKSCTVTVRFAPAAAGTATAALTAAGQHATATDTLTGTCKAPTRLYWLDKDASTITEANLDGSNPQVIDTGVLTEGSEFDFPVVPLAVGSSHIYWPDPYGGTIKEANLDGTGVTTVASGLFDPSGVAVGPQ